MGEAIQAFDILLTPTMSTVARPHGGIYTLTNDTVSGDKYMEASDGECGHLGVFNVTGQPSVSLPLTQSAHGLPIGIQIVGRFGDEATLVRMARDVEDARPWAGRRPKVELGQLTNSCGQ
ncbi:amidase family protein [Mesorhizobium sp.]|uniref:amidase family protein n=1 Tax=Mesorhizobium sp. TaxID=1871066 RepID=UPI0025DAFE93|nr:amidase family protein [Mesorhizobium sp.]